ncbi:M23 family metallopeptidase [Tenacibaculum sp.]|nr:M23 family metallopeptidase [Tenacibaculum sp.]
MKLLQILFFMVLINISGYGQERDLFKFDQDSIIQLFVQDSVNKIEYKKKDNLPIIWIPENWDTSTYNPYKKRIKAYPFNIVFTDSTYASPIERKKVITSRYGRRNRRPHKGIDIDLITGDNVIAMLDGKVRYVNSQTGHGKLVVIRHFNGLETVYTHLSKQLVKVNQMVTKGQIIGKGGTTGNARGSHLHLEVSYKGIYINPEYLFDFGIKNKVRSLNLWVSKKWVTPYIHNSKRQSNISICSTYEQALQSDKKEKHIYIVKKGDTLSKISNKHYVSITSICRTNLIVKTSTLRVGQKLMLIQ